MRGVRILASSLAKRYVGEPMVETMGLIGMLSLCTLGSQIRRERTMNLDCGLHISPVWNPLLVWLVRLSCLNAGHLGLGTCALIITAARLSLPFIAPSA